MVVLSSAAPTTQIFRHQTSTQSVHATARRCANVSLRALAELCIHALCCHCACCAICLTFTQCCHCAAVAVPQEQSDAEASDSDADGPASAEPSGVEAEAEAAATAAQLAAEARKAHQVAKLVNIANQADHTPIMLVSRPVCCRTEHSNECNSWPPRSSCSQFKSRTLVRKYIVIQQTKNIVILLIDILTCLFGHLENLPIISLVWLTSTTSLWIVHRLICWAQRVNIVVKNELGIQNLDLQNA